jgi:hypothetical protein
MVVVLQLKGLHSPKTLIAVCKGFDDVMEIPHGEQLDCLVDVLLGEVLQRAVCSSERT